MPSCRALFHHFPLVSLSFRIISCPPRLSRAFSWIICSKPLSLFYRRPHHLETRWMAGTKTVQAFMGRVMGIMDGHLPNLIKAITRRQSHASLLMRAESCTEPLAHPRRPTDTHGLSAPAWGTCLGFGYGAGPFTTTASQLAGCCVAVAPGASRAEARLSELHCANHSTSEKPPKNLPQ